MASQNCNSVIGKKFVEQASLLNELLKYVTYLKRSICMDENTFNGSINLGRGSGILSNQSLNKINSSSKSSNSLANTESRTTRKTFDSVGTVTVKISHTLLSADEFVPITTPSAIFSSSSLSGRSSASSKAK